MRLVLRNHFLSRFVYDDLNRLMYIIKGHVLNVRKTITSADGTVIYETGITNLHEFQNCNDSAANRQYSISKPDASGKCLTSANLAFTAKLIPTMMKRYIFKAPLVNQMIIGPADMVNIFIIWMQKDRTFKISDSDSHLLGTIHRYQLFKGYQIDFDSKLSDAFAIALFELTRYMIKENELIIV